MIWKLVEFRLGNSELSNHFGNLVNRVVHLIHKYYGGVCPKLPLKEEIEQGRDEDLKLLLSKVKPLVSQMQKSVFEMRLHQGLENVVEVLRQTNRFLEEKRPWKKVFTHKEEAGQSFASALEVLRLVAFLLSPILPQACRSLLKRLGCQNQNFEKVSSWGHLKEGQSILEGPALFPRITKEA